MSLDDLQAEAESRVAELEEENAKLREDSARRKQLLQQSRKILKKFLPEEVANPNPVLAMQNAGPPGNSAA